MAKPNIHFRVSRELYESLKSQLVLERKLALDNGVIALPTWTDLLEMLLKKGLHLRTQDLTIPPTSPSAPLARLYHNSR